MVVLSVPAMVMAIFSGPISSAEAAAPGGDRTIDQGWLLPGPEVRVAGTDVLPLDGLQDKMSLGKRSSSGRHRLGP